ncbi:MAG TPA: MYXO-CTERM sorting domain-containing protein, partial [Polyangiaceae bacterium]|nr:MYXO-CTERM sorting domain-containing protein [Polyangiaceae bacterium]
EDENANGATDARERDPNDASDDDSAGGAGGAAGAGGDPGAGGDFNSAGAAGESGAGGSAASPDPNQVLEGGGCDCGIPRASSPWSSVLALGCIALAVARRRRRTTALKR